MHKVLEGGKYKAAVSYYQKDSKCSKIISH